MRAGKKKIIVGMSGGVDSSVAAALLVEQGHDVIGAFMKNWTAPSCGWEDERRDALRVSAILGIPFFTFDFESEYRERVIGYLEREYAAGRTPNPDVLCNREVKFDLFLSAALAHGAEMIATGHYARIGADSDGAPTLLVAADANKDQTYFLHQLSGAHLAKTLFPIGHLAKPEVRRIARARGLPTADKKDSVGICFVGEVNMREFLRSRIKERRGPVVTTAGEVVGVHRGMAALTIGQRHGIGLTSSTHAAKGEGAPYFVVEKDAARNTLVVSHDSADLLARALATGAAHWISGTVPAFPLHCQARIRYRQPLQDCVVERYDDGLRVTFDVPQRAVTPGQFVVFHRDEECLGGAAIARVLPKNTD